MEDSGLTSACPVQPLKDKSMTDEQLLELANAPSQRDVLFAQKADLVILLWDGQSVGIGQLADWFRKQRRNHLLAFI